jgi:AcrR family transcriptional regulator
MVRLARFTADSFVEAAVALVAEGGPSAATIAAIARRAGAPTGSVYHRFESRAAVIATAWTSVYGEFLGRVAPPLEAGDPAAAALAMLDWARAKPQAARFLLLNEIEDLLDGPPPAPLQRIIAAQQEALEAAFRRALPAPSAADEEAVARLRFLVFDGPLAVLRPHLVAGKPIPAYADAMVLELHNNVGAGMASDLRRPMEQVA